MKLSRKIDLHPLFLVLAAGSLFLDFFWNIFFMYSITLIHEGAHILTARLLGYPMQQLRIMPFGIEVRFVHEREIPAGKLAIIAAAGPLVNLVLAASIYALHAQMPPQIWTFLCMANLSLVLVNLLPAVPLDGGKIFKAILLLRMSELKATRLVLLVGKATALFMIGAGVFFFFTMEHNFSVLLIAVFVLSCAISEGKDYKQMEQKLMFNYKEKLRISGGQTIPVHSIAAKPSVPLRKLIRQFDLERYNIVYVLDEDMRTQRTLTEGEVIDGVVELGAGARLSALDKNK